MPAPRIEIDPDSGFCFGVVTAINKAEANLPQPKMAVRCTVWVTLYTTPTKLSASKPRDSALSPTATWPNCTIPKYCCAPTANRRKHIALHAKNDIEIVDATCPVVLKLQQRIKAAYDRPDSPQIVIYGKIGHAEVNGLVGQTEGTAIVVEHVDDLDKIDFNRPVALYSQTTKSVEGFRAIAEQIRRRIDSKCSFTSYDTICRSVSKRVDRLREFASSHDIIIFVAGTKSSNRQDTVQPLP